MSETRLSEALIGALTITLGLTIALPTVGPLKAIVLSVGGSWLWASTALACGAIEMLAALTNVRTLRFVGGLASVFLWVAVLTIYAANGLLTLASIEAPVIALFALLCALSARRDAPR